MTGLEWYKIKKEASRQKIQKLRDRRTERLNLETPVPVAVCEIDYTPVETRDDITIAPKIVVVMATFHPRKVGMLRVINQLLPQCDKMCIYMNGYTEIPEEMPQSDKLELVLAGEGCEHPDISSKGKHYWLDKYANDYYLTVDDDINYPKDYCKGMVNAIEKYGRKAIICCHGARYKVVDGVIPAESQARAHKIYYCYQKELKSDVIIHEPGNGCSGSHPKSIGLTPACSVGSIHSGDDGDIGLFSQANQVPVVCIARAKGWLTPMPDVWHIGAQHMDIDKVTLQSEKARSWKSWKLMPVVIGNGKVTEDAELTISMPTFNTPIEDIVRAVESVLSQSLKPIVLYVVNDGGGHEVWKHLAHIQDDRLVRVQMPDNAGAHACHSYVLSICKTIWWSPVDSDDYMSVDRFEKLWSVRKGKEVIMGGYTGVKFGSHKHCTIHETPFSPVETPNIKCTGCSWAGGIWSVRFLRLVGGINGSFKVGYDSALQSLALRYGKVRIVQDYGYYYVSHKTSLTHSPQTGFGSQYREKCNGEINRRLGMCKEIEGVAGIMSEEFGKR